MWLSWSHHGVSDCAARTDSKRLGRALAHQLSGGPSERPSGRSSRKRESAVRPRRARRRSGRSDLRRVPAARRSNLLRRERQRHVPALPRPDPSDLAAAARARDVAVHVVVGCSDGLPAHGAGRFGRSGGALGAVELQTPVCGSYGRWVAHWDLLRAGGLERAAQSFGARPAAAIITVTMRPTEPDSDTHPYLNIVFWRWICVL